MECTVVELRLCSVCRNSIPTGVEYVRYCYEKEKEVVDCEAKECEEFNSIIGG